MNRVRFLFFPLLFPLFGCGDPDPFPTLNPPAVFSLPTNLSKTTASGCPQAPPGCSITPAVAVDGSGDIHAVWAEDGEILFSRSTDGGATFSAGRNISNTAGLSATPAVAVDGAGHINAVWEENFVVLSLRSTDGGATFSDPVTISDPVGFSGTLAIAVDRTGAIHIVYEQDWDIFYRQSTDGGATFSAAQDVSNTAAADDLTTGISTTPTVAVDRSGNINVVWEEDFVIMFRRSTNGGMDFSAAQSLSDLTGISETPSIAAAESGDIQAVWQQDWDIYFSRFTADNGGTLDYSFSRENLSNTAVSGATGFSATPAVAVDGSGRINVVWEEDFRIVFRRSLTGGAGFSAVQDLSIPSAVATLPALAVDGSGAIHAVWQDDDLTGNTEIFFVKGE